MLNPEIISKIEKSIKRDYQLRFNVVTDRLELYNEEKQAYIAVDDYKYNSILRKLNKQGLPCTLKELQQILESDFTQRVDPIKEYFEQLEEWNQDVDYIQQLSETVTTHNDTLWHKYFKMWLVGIVASIMEQKPNHTMLVLSGEQGIGKTSWLNKLISPVLSDYIYNGVINPKNRDELSYLSSRILIIMDELEILNRKELGRLKQMITNPSILTRLAYRRNSKNMVRRASFCASVNNKKFLFDKTGNRRFLCFETAEIDYEHEIAMDKVYAQALYLLKDGFQYWFDKKTIEECNFNNNNFSVRSPEEELLLSCFSPENNGSSECHLTNNEIIEVIAKNKNVLLERIRVKSLGHALRKNGFFRLKVKGRWKYRLFPNENIIL